MSEQKLEDLAALASIEMDVNSQQQLALDLTAIMNFVKQLCDVNTVDIMPLLHPLDQHQRLRSDEVKEVSQVCALGKIAPVFDQDLYWVPKIIDSGQ